MEREAPGASAEAVRAQLRRILGSPHFDALQRSRKFLAAVIEEASAGRSDRIEAQSRPVAPALIRPLCASLAKAGLPGLSPISGD